MFRHVTSRVKKFLAALALLSVEMLVVLVLFILALIVFIYLTRRIIFLHNDKFDLKVFNFLSQHVSKSNNDIMLFFTFLGTHKFLIPANLVLIAYFLFINKHKWYSIKVPAIALSSLALMFGLKQLFDRPRPLIPLLEHARGLSFPSGHALMSVTFYGLLIHIVWKFRKHDPIKWPLTIILLLLILIIGFSRIYLRVHYASDVMAGFCVGLLWLVISIWALKQIEQYSKKEVNPVVQQASIPSEKT